MTNDFLNKRTSKHKKSLIIKEKAICGYPSYIRKISIFISYHEWEREWVVEGRLFCFYYFKGDIVQNILDGYEVDMTHYHDVFKKGFILLSKECSTKRI
mgnify:CR=1 FL=1